MAVALSPDFVVVTLSPVNTVNRKITVNHHCCQQVNFRREIKLVVCRDALHVAILSVVWTRQVCFKNN